MTSTLIRASMHEAGRFMAGPCVCVCGRTGVRDFDLFPGCQDTERKHFLFFFNTRPSSHPS